MGIEESKITVTPNAPREGCEATKNKAPLREAGVSEPYVLHVSNFDERKNPEGILNGWRQAAKNGIPHDLVIAGSGWKNQKFPEWATETDRISLLGFVPFEWLPSLYSHASVLLFPSYEEGFGMPAVEAMNCGAPVVAGNGGALPEVVKDGGVIINPDNHAEIARGVKEAMQIDKQAIKSRANNFSWETTARKTWETYTRISNNR